MNFSDLEARLTIPRGIRPDAPRKRAIRRSVKRKQDRQWRRDQRENGN